MKLLNPDQLWSLVLPRLREYMGHTWNIDVIADVTNSIPATVSGWLIGQEPPGERLIRLWHALDALGIESPEINQMQPFSRYCGQLLTFGLADLSEITEIVGLSNKQSCLRTLRGSPPMHPQLSLEDLHSHYDKQLQQARSKLVAIKTKPQTIKQKPTPKVPTAAVRVLADGQGADPVLFAATLLSAVLPHARHLDSDACTPQDRSRIRALMGEDGMFDLSNHLNNLCSERARQHGRTGQ